jgi:hypothetical protein
MRGAAALLLLTASVSVPAQAPVMRDSAGIRILDYRGVTPSRQVVVSTEALATIGAQGTGQAELLDGVVGAARLSDGRIVVAQSKVTGQRCGGSGCALNGSLLAAIYDSSGKVQSIFGRMGRGPGELSQGILALRVIDGDTIVLADQRGGIIIYDGAGKYVSQFQLTDAEMRGPPMMIGIAPDGDIVGMMSVGRYNGVPARTLPEGLVAYRDTLGIKQFDRSGIARRTVAVIAGDSASFTHTVTKMADGGVRYGMTSTPRRSLLPSLCWSSSICKGTGEGNDVVVYSGGRATQILRFPPPSVAESREASIRMVPGTGDDLWVSVKSNGVSRWWIIAKDGRVAATSDLGKAGLLQVGRDFVVVLRTDTDGVQFVEVRRTSLR